MDKQFHQYVQTWGCALFLFARGDYYFYEQHQDFVAYQDSSFATERTDYHIVSVGEIETGDRPQSVKEKLIYERNVRMCEDNVKQGSE